MGTLQIIAESATAIGTLLSAIALIFGWWQLREAQSGNRIAQKRLDESATALITATTALNNNERLLGQHADALNMRASTVLRSIRAQTILHCNLRYNELYTLRIEIDVLTVQLDGMPSRSKQDHLKIDEINKIIEIKTNGYFRRLWGLQSDQLDYWLAGYVDPETLSSWVAYILDNFTQDKARRVGSLTYKQAWNSLGQSHKNVNPSFYKLMNKLIEISDNQSTLHAYDAMLEYLQSVEQDRESIISALSRINVDRFTMKQFRDTRASPNRKADEQPI